MDEAAILEIPRRIYGVSDLWCRGRKRNKEREDWLLTSS
jgi:hypothetical protein